ncbi:hypothetical protein EW146_g6538 [Bondarzewia mesenterica]|uniref:NADP-dependent oxidoreductase domain-containing protein n=1 Tax=Bondarzewia mesenterica TaxID=1095465 RepID=A0A4S4LNW5_9AGAM|nr:hypothetical protein EW146_g6538 [Bondarzewia mesenterica]
MTTVKLPTRKIGSTDVTAIGFGAMGLSAFYGSVSTDEERLKVRILDAVYAHGCTNWDTADAYADSEDLIGKWFKRTGKRDEIFLATKFGFGPPSGKMIDGDPAYARAAIEKSLKRLGTDHVDLWYLHRADKTVPIEKTVGAMAEFVKAGKVKYLGLSEVSESTLRRAHAVHPISALQVEYSIFTLDIEDPKIGLLKAARELGITIVAYAPLGRGFLTGQFLACFAFWQRSPDDLPEDGLKSVGEKHKATAGQVALAWLLEQGEDVIPIPGTKRVKYLEENLGALNVKLTADDLKAVRVVAEKADAQQGERYPPEFLDSMFSDTPPL